MALRLRGRELVAPDEAWAHFYPEPLTEPRADALTGTPIMGVPSVDEFARTRSWLHQKVLGTGGSCTYLLTVPSYSSRTVFHLGYLTFLLTKVLGAKIEWVRELLRYCTGRATLRAYDTPAHIFADDKDGVKVSKY